MISNLKHLFYLLFILTVQLLCNIWSLSLASLISDTSGSTDCQFCPKKNLSFEKPQNPCHSIQVNSHTWRSTGLLSPFMISLWWSYFLLSWSNVVFQAHPGPGESAAHMEQASSERPCDQKNPGWKPRGAVQGALSFSCGGNNYMALTWYKHLIGFFIYTYFVQ